MYHCPRRNKGILDKQFVSVGVVFRRDMSYQRVLEKCISVVFPTSTPGDEYYIANGRGMPICDADCIRMDNEKGIEEKVPWTLETYIKLSHIRYASKARFYCVKRSTGTLVIIYNLYMWGHFDIPVLKNLCPICSNFRRKGQ